jgi:hypothetical protein
MWRPGALPAGTQDPEPHDTWHIGALPVGLEPQYTWRRRNPSYQGGEIWSRWTRGAPELSQRVQSHNTRGSASALLIRKAGSGTAGYVAVHGCTPRSLSWLKLVCWGIRSTGTDTPDLQNHSPPVLSKTAKPGNFWYKIQFMKFGKIKPKTKWIFWFIDRFLAGFLFEI